MGSWDMINVVAAPPNISKLTKIQNARYSQRNGLESMSAVRNVAKPISDCFPSFKCKKKPPWGSVTANTSTYLGMPRKLTAGALSSYE